jgi:hypothetical protein
MIVSHRERRIERHWRDADGTWRIESAGRGQVVPLASIGATLAVDAIYDRSPVTSGI